MRNDIVLRGLPTSPGIAIGKVFFFGQDSLIPEHKTIAPGMIEKEIQRFDFALEKTKTSTEKTRDKAIKEMGEIVGRIFDSHLLILEDILLQDEIRNKISRERRSADCAIYDVFRKNYESLISQKKDYFRERADDIRDIGSRLLLSISGKSDIFQLTGNEPCIIAARLITPSEIVHIDRKLLLGIMTDMGGATSHTAILTRALEVPAVVGLKKVSEYSDLIDLGVVNGNSGKVILNPSSETKQVYQEKQKRFLKFFISLTNLKEQPSMTTDGRKISLTANIELPHEVQAADIHGAEGIGLYRTEYLYLMNNRFPSEDEQFEEYKRTIELMAPRPVTIRTFDLGGDKAPQGLEIGREANPFMGLRAIRISLAKPDLFKAQLKAVLRASHYGKTRLMFPLVTCISELRKIKAILRNVKQELRKENVLFDEDMKIGVMIEVPSAVMMAPEMAKEVDFFSIGTNDLIQFTLAADRGNEMIAGHFQSLHPALLRMIRMVVDAGESRKIEVGMCGEMAADPLATVLLVGLGLNQLSFSPLMLPEIKKIIRSISYKEAREFADKMLKRKTPNEVKKMTNDMMKKKFADLPIWFSQNDNNH